MAGASLIGGNAPEVDWQQPWLAPWRSLGEAAWQQVRQGLPVAEALHAVAAAQGVAVPVRLVSAATLPPDEAYEQFIFRTRSVPTRNNLHDFFNGLCWLRLPQLKARLNALQAGQIARDGVGAVRGPLRDAITVFDENGAVLLAPPALHDALRARDWQRLFVGLRPLWQQTTLVLVGHALLEKLVSPRKQVTAHVFTPHKAINSVANMVDVDGLLAQALDAATLAQKPFSPLPVLGVPGWWAQNLNFSFYDDPQVFRPPRPHITNLQPGVALLDSEPAIPI